ncbi:MAG TPA: hypothetical protein VGK59_17885, partial [Ohtaekwangia sp.]
MKKPVVITLLLFIAFQTEAKPKDYLQECWNKLVRPAQGQYLTFSYQEKLNELQHNFEPWQQTNYAGTGVVWTNAENFLKSDTLTNLARNRSYYSKTQLTPTDLLFLDYGDKDLYSVTKSMFLDQSFQTARYSPLRLVSYFYLQKAVMDKETNKEFAVYTLTINKTIVRLFIGKENNLLHKVTTLHDDDLFGDVLTTYTYSNYETLANLSYPKRVDINKINGKVKDEVIVSVGKMVPEIPALLTKPDNYTMKEDVTPQPDVTVEKYNNHIHFIVLKHTDDKVMVVEFNDFLLVAEAPVKSSNGELIIAEAAKIAPGKPIRYFVFGHYHPHYLGGIRPFISRGAKVIASKGDQEYVNYLASAPHTLNPDQLQRQPKPVVFEEIKDSLTITDSA